MSGKPQGRFPLLPRKKNTDKTTYGHALIAAGSRSMPGAAAIVSRACLASGAGLVTAALDRSLQKQSSVIPPEAMRLWTAGAHAQTRVLRYIKERRVNVCAVGPGLTVEKNAQKLARALVRSVRVPVVLDADGLNAFRGRAEELKKRRAALVLTPHHKEFERLFGIRVPARPAEQARLAKKLARLYDGVLVLKGHRTVVTDGVRSYVNSTGNPGLAKGGSGDALTGVITAFIAQGLQPFKAACWAVYFHGRAADLAVRKTGQLGLTATDIIEFLPKAFTLG